MFVEDPSQARKDRPVDENSAHLSLNISNKRGRAPGDSLARCWINADSVGKLSVSPNDFMISLFNEHEPIVSSVFIRTGAVILRLRRKNLSGFGVKRRGIEHKVWIESVSFWRT